MKNLDYTMNRILKVKTVMVLFAVLMSQFATAQCTTTNFTVAKTNATCSSNGKITVTIPNSTVCTGWVAELVKQNGGGTSSVNFPTTGGAIDFNSLSVGSYDLRLSNGVSSISYSGNPIVITSSYVDMTYSFSTTPPTCPNSLDGNVTATIGAGKGTGPFVFKLVSPTLGTKISEPQMARNYTFTGLKGNESVDLSITDQINGETGCEVTVFRPGYITARQTFGGLSFNGGVRAFNFYRNCSNPNACGIDMVINLANVTSSRKAKLDEDPLNAKIKINGVFYPLTLVQYSSARSTAQYTYDRVATGGPILTNGMQVEAQFVDVCGVLSATSTVTMLDNYLHVYNLPFNDPATCTTKYTLRVENFYDGNNFRAITFCKPNSLVIKKRVQTNPDFYAEIPAGEITLPTDPTNPLGLGYTSENSIAWGRVEYILSKPGTYKLVAKDDCHEVERIVTVNEVTSLLNAAAVVEGKSTLQGTSAINVLFGSIAYKSPINIKITRKDGATLKEINPTGPLGLGGQKFISFPINAVYTFSDNVARSYTISDLPLGEYNVELSNGVGGCPGTTTAVVRTINLTSGAEYGMLDGNNSTQDTPVKVELGCLGSSKIIFDMGKNGNVNNSGYTELWSATPQGAPIAYIATTGGLPDGYTTLSGSFSNLNPGNYLVRVRNIYGGYSPAEASVNKPANGPWDYSVFVNIPEFKPLKTQTATVFCSPDNPDSGIIVVEITEGTVTYPLTFELFNSLDPTNRIGGYLIGPEYAPYNIRQVSFENMAQGNYFIRTSTPCYAVDSNVTVSTAGTVPTAQVENSTICQGSSTKLAIYTTQNLFTVNWTKKDDSTVIGTGSSITVTPSTTTTYTAHYQLREEYQCGSTQYQSDVTVTVLPVNLDIDVTPTQIDLCGTSSHSLTVKNAASGFNYEVVDANGNSFTPVLKKAGTGADLVFNLTGYSLIPGTNLKIKPTSTNPAASCTATLEKEVAIISGSKRDDLRVIGSTVCPNIDGTITIEGAENGVQYEILRSNASLSPNVKGTGNGGNLTLTVPSNQLLSTTTTFTIRASNSGCTPVILRNSAQITVLSPPTANAGGDFTKTCILNPTGATIGMTAENGTTYAWTAVPTSSAALLSATNVSNPVANPIVPTEYTLTVTDANGCKATDKVNVAVNLAAPSVNLGADFNITCTSNPNGKTLGSTIAGATYLWSTASNSSLATTATLVVNLSTSTTYNLVATYTNTGCAASDSINVTVDKSLPTVDAGSDFTKTCVNFTSGKEIGVAEISGVTYSWSPATGLSDASLANPIANPSTTTTYILTTTKTATGCTATDTVVVTVDTSVPVADAGVDFTKTCATNATGKLIGVAAVAGVTYSWSPATGLSDASIANPMANPSATTTYTLTATKIATGCSAIDTVIATVALVPNPVATAVTIENNCPLETLDLVGIQPQVVDGIVYEWWTGTQSARDTQIINTTSYNRSGNVYLWGKTISEGCYNATASEVAVVITPCCAANVGVITDNNPFYLNHYAPADITILEHTGYSSPSKVIYVLVNDLDGKIKQINDAKPEFLGVLAGNYTVHALVFGTTATPTGIEIGNKLGVIQPLCGSSATFSITVLPYDCISDDSFSQTIPNAKQYALLDSFSNQFVQVNTTGVFATIFTGIPHQIVGFNYTGSASGIVVGGTLSEVMASDLEITAGTVITGCAPVGTQIDGILYNDRDKNCKEGDDTQYGLPTNTIYLKLLNSNNEVIQVVSTNADAGYYFSFYSDLFDGTYSIIVDDNDNLSDSVATYPSSWKGNSQTFTIEFGQIVEYLSNSANFVPMCMQSATEKPAPKRTPNLQGNTYHFCKDAPVSSLSVDAVSGAVVNWYTNATGGDASTIAPIPNTAVVGVKTCYVSQTLNGAESDRTEINIEVHALPEQPTVIAGDDFVGAGTSQIYSVVNASSALSYNWILPSEWTGSSTTKDITVVVGDKSATIGVTATSAYGCVSPIQQLDVRVVIEDDIEVYNSVSPNGDGENDIFRIRNIDFYPDNTLSIFNRWGLEVYRVTSYGQDDNFFKGFSDGRSTVSRDVELPEGVYFYTLTYKNTKGIEKNLSGYLYIKQ